MSKIIALWKNSASRVVAKYCVLFAFGKTIGDARDFGIVWSAELKNSQHLHFEY